MSENTRKEVAARAYAIWESEGRPEGKCLDHWLRAEAEQAKATKSRSLTRAGRLAKRSLTMPERKLPPAKIAGVGKKTEVEHGVYPGRPHD